MSKKGISSLIAVVLLIAFTVAVGGILSVWLTTLSTQQTESTEEAYDKTIKCSHVPRATEVIFRGGASGDLCNITLEYLHATEPLYNFTITFIDSDRKSYNIPAINITPQYNNTAGQRFTPGMISVWNLNITKYSGNLNTLTAPSLQAIYVTAFCQVDYPVTAKCTAGDPCMK